MADPKTWIRARFPKEDPNWDPNVQAQQQKLQDYRQALLSGMKAVARKPTNMAKVSEIMQGAREPPGAFLERLMEAYRVYTPFDPEAAENL